MYGNKTLAADTRALTSVVGELEITHAGNIVLRVGRLNPGIGWRQTEHIVLTPQEANRLSSELSQKVGEAASR